jgi:hypothetical protein
MIVSILLLVFRDELYEHTRNGNNDDLLASPLLVGIVKLRDTTDSRVLIHDGSPAELDTLGELVTSLENHCECD